MIAELRGQVPKVPLPFCATLINRAWGEIRKNHLWSFNLYESSWISPPVLTTGTVTVVQGSDTVQFDATATAAINTWQIQNPYTLVTQCQLRPGNVAGIAQIYNLIQYDQINGSATLDRIYADPSGTNVAYQLYQLYYAPPFIDHKQFISVRNMQMFLDLYLDTERNEVDKADPQRSIYQFPTNVIPYLIDNRGAGTVNASATLGFKLFELWGQPVNPFTYDLYGIRDGEDLVNPTDTLPYAVGEDCVIALSKYYAYQWAESNKDMSPRSAGPDFKFLMGLAMNEYKQLLVMYRRNDKEFVDAFYSRIKQQFLGYMYGSYSAQFGVATTYGGWY
jgi:hypothetical protein